MPELYFYGERGIINGLVLDLMENLERLRAFLQSIHWCAPQAANWAPAVTDAVYLVEPGFGQFGQPDLIIICRLRDGSRRWLIIEAKTGFYRDCTMPNSTGMGTPKYNSSINGQISLNFRLALALEHFVNGNSKVVETEGVLVHYRDALKDSASSPRSLAKKLTIRQIVEPLLCGLKMKDAYFLAMTLDRGGDLLGSVPADELPLMYDETGRLPNDLAAERLGFLSIPELQEIGGSEWMHYRKACDVYLPPRPGVRAEGGPAGFDPFILRTETSAVWMRASSSTLQPIMDEVEACIAGYGECKPCKGSYSCIVAGKTCAKVIPLSPRCAKTRIAFSTAFPSAGETAGSLGQCRWYEMIPSKQRFVVAQADAVHQRGQIVEALVQFLMDAAQGT